MHSIQNLFLAFILCFSSTVNAALITNEADIVDIVAAINIGEIQAAELAMKKAQNPEVKKFAKQMHDHHNALNKEMLMLDMQLDIPNDRSERSIMIREKNEFSLNRLKDKTGKDFDEAYMEDQVMMHKLALETIQHILIPSAKHAQLKSTLQKAEGKVKHHLQQAEAIEEKVDN